MVFHVATEGPMPFLLEVGFYRVGGGLSKVICHDKAGSCWLSSFLSFSLR